MVTAYGREEVLREAEEAGLKDFLVKPVSPSILFDTAVRVLSGEDTGERGLVHEAFDRDADFAALQGAAILLVEDNELNQEVAAGLLAEIGLEVDIAKDGRVAVEMVGRRDYDIVLMDMQMPVMDGVAATIEIRKDSRFRDLPIVAMTANAMQQDQERCTAAGMNGHVAKPIEPDELFRTLLKWVRPRVTPVPAVATAAPAAAPPALVAATQAPAGATVAPASGQEEPLPVIAGLDVALGVRRLLGKRRLYLDQLRGYVSSQRDVPQAIRQALDQDDRATAERLAHTARGVSGNIAATGLAVMAGLLETQIREGAARPTLEATLAGYAEALAILIAAVEAWMPAPPVPAAAVAMDREKVLAVLAQLADLLGQYDGEAAVVIDESGEHLEALLGSEAFAEIERATREYEFNTALDLLRQRAGALQIAI